MRKTTRQGLVSHFMLNVLLIYVDVMLSHTKY